MTKIGGHELKRGAHPFLLIAGPCVIESEAHTLRMAEALAEICNRLGIPFVFKASFDKANRTSEDSYRGLGLVEGCEALLSVEARIGCPTLTDIHESWQAEVVGEVVDCLQIPAFLCRQTDLINAAANFGKAVNIKKGQWLAPEAMRHAVDKARRANPNVTVTERGSAHGYGDLVVDMRSLDVMAEFAPVIFDATHSVQTPGGATTGGERRYVPLLARAAIAAGVAGLFLEVHDDPDNAPSDGPNMIELSKLESLLIDLLAISEAGAP